MTTSERQLENELIAKLTELKYIHREKFQQLNRVKLTDDGFQRLLEEIVTPDVFTAAQTLRTRNSFTREDGTPLNYTLVNIDDWCKNTFEVVNQLRINTERTQKELALMTKLVPLLKKRAGGREISGLKVYEENL